MKVKMPEKENFDWKLYPKAEEFLQGKINTFVSHHQVASRLARKIEAETSTRFVDWIDHLVLPEKETERDTLTELGFTEDAQGETEAAVFRHLGSIFFPVLIQEGDDIEMALKPENIIHFRNAHAIDRTIEGEKFAPYRRMEVAREGNFLLSTIERRGYADFTVTQANDVGAYTQALETFTSRKREVANDFEPLKAIRVLVEKLLKDLRPARVADAFFRTERSYWLKRNEAARVQKKRQDELGLGYGNHDHHTFRSSRTHFQALINIFELMGFQLREHFYAGEKAGWGAQILEHPECGLVVFADVDLGPEEKDIDFAHRNLPERKDLGTVGLWVGLHGESILQAGLHHLATRFDFEKVEKDLAPMGVEFMTPFSDFSFLKQEFTRGKAWRPRKQRLKRLLERHLITKKEFENFKEDVIGSHVENIERGQGFKGFNQDSVSVILERTDPRKIKERGA
ncbi:MAG: hypothetical protein GWO20_02810 [Candidatus Korarchaeota archaeon]|nr:hypothetical protein [Candidatus Korarchaeota archaeon]NIU82403.1 hypothetical protein [Candidatus Thorarchaeota archaeon]NIW12876.1 hypothetical protein [Candidatus Thorarchaeota archaeon]NIW51070.1 hypothetical protein [Candidatus Korarchaeota archaeon]